MVSDSELGTRLEEILRESDLDTTTAATVRRQLEKDFGVDLSHRKAFVRNQIDIFLQTLRTDEQHEDQEAMEENDKAGAHSESVDNDGNTVEGDEDAQDGEEEGSEEERVEREQKVKKKKKKKKKKRGGFQKLCSLSPQLEKVLGVSKLPRTEVVKRLWLYIKEHNLQDPKNRRNIVCDESLHAIFRVKSINMFRMNKTLSNHIWPLRAEKENGSLEIEGEASDSSMSAAESVGDHKGGEEGRDGEQGTEDGEQEEEKEEGKDDGDNYTQGRINERLSKVDKKVKKRGGFTRLCSLSPRLQAFIGEPELARTEVVKRLWAYIRENNLQDPKNRRKILCDDALHDLFRVNSINMFQMNKALSKHICPLSNSKGPAESAKLGTGIKHGREEGMNDGTQEETQQKKRCSGFLAPFQLSDPLVKFLGTGENVLSRADVVKRIWNYIKDNGLQDPSNKRTILCDGKLKELFEVDSFNGFSVPKLLTAHLIKMEQ